MIGAPLLITVAIQLAIQLYKVVFYSVRHGELQWWRFTSAGGMPSAHSAFVSALVATLALHEGLASSAFAVAVVLASVVAFDAIRVRGVIERHSQLLRQLVAERSRAGQGRQGGGSADGDGIDGDGGRAHEVGHSAAEVAIGIVVGASLAAVAYLTLVT